MSKVKAIAARSFRYRGGKGGQAKLYNPGDPVPCNDEQYQDLMRQGALVPESDDDVESEGESSGRQGARRDDQQEIKVVIENMLADDPDKKVETHWKKDGSPRAKAVNSGLEFDASAEEIDAVWAAAFVPAGEGKDTGTQGGNDTTGESA